jgi:hypothetical protein
VATITLSRGDRVSPGAGKFGKPNKKYFAHYENILKAAEAKSIRLEMTLIAQTLVAVAVLSYLAGIEQLQESAAATASIDSRRIDFAAGMQEPRHRRRVESTRIPGRRLSNG